MGFDDRSRLGRDSNVILGSSCSDGYSGGKEHPCAGCQTLDCHSMHGPVKQDCLLKSCYFCTDLARIDNEIARVYDRLSHLVRERQENIAKIHHENIIDRLPVEILSMIFVFLRDAIIDLKFKLVHTPAPLYTQPSPSPPLLAGAVCKGWREITLATPQLWTDIIINLYKDAEGQLNMIKAWARRSGAAPLDVAIYGNKFKVEDEDEFLDDFGGVLWKLRSLAPRWHNIALNVPAIFFEQLLNNLQDIPPINTLFIETQHRKPIQMLHPLRPRRLIYCPCQASPRIPMEWNRLVFIEIEDIDQGEMLHIIRTAPNLRHCIGMGEDYDGEEFPIPTRPITNRSLLSLKTSYNIIDHLTLPSLRDLDYVVWNELEQRFSSIIEFMDRSRAPLDNFILRCHFSIRPAHTLPFERLHWITSLFLHFYNSWVPLGTAAIDNVFLTLTRRSILPRLREIEVEMPHMSALSWSMFSFLLRRNAGPKPSVNDATSNTSIPLATPLSRASIRLTKPFTNTMDKDTFLRLLEAKKSGVDLTIVGLDGEDLFDEIAKFHGVAV